MPTSSAVKPAVSTPIESDDRVKTRQEEDKLEFMYSLAKKLRRAMQWLIVCHRTGSIHHA